MSIANPLVLSINGNNKSLPKINQDNYGSEYYLRSATDEYRVRIRHSEEAAQKNGTKFDRHNVELTFTVFSTVVGVPDDVLQVYAVLRNPSGGNVTTLGHLQVGLNTLLSASMVSDLAGWQN